LWYNIEVELNKKNSQFLLIAAGALLLAIIGYLLFQNYQLRQKLTPPQPPDVVLLDKKLTEPAETANWKTYTFDSIKLTFKAPPDLFVTGQEQKNSDTGVPYSFTLYAQNSDDTHPLPSGKKFYQLYGVFQWSSTITDAEFQAHKEDFIASSIKGVTVGGYPGIRGQYKGERNRYVTMFMKNGGLFTLSTSDPLPENESLSNQILQTFQFTQ